MPILNTTGSSGPSTAGSIPGSVAQSNGPFNINGTTYPNQNATKAALGANNEPPGQPLNTLPATGPLYTNNLAANQKTPQTAQSNAQVASAFVNPYANSIYSNIAGLATLQNQANYANSPLAGLTNLGAMNMAGNTNLGGAATVGNTNINTGTTNNLTAGQLAQINMLNQQAQGQGPSVAAVQAQQQGQQNVANEMAMMASQRGSSNSALGARAAQDAMAANNQQAIQAGVLGRTQEELNAQGQLSGALGNANSQAANVAQAQAQLSNQNLLANQSSLNTMGQAQGTLSQQLALQNAAAQNQAALQQGTMQQQTSLANQAAQAQTQGMNANMYGNAVQAQANEAQNNMQAAENYENMVTNQSTALQGGAVAQNIASGQQQAQMVGAGVGALGALASAAAASDKRLKTGIKSANKSISDFLSKVSSPTRFNLLEVA